MSVSRINTLGWGFKIPKKISTEKFYDRDYSQKVDFCEHKDCHLIMPLSHNKVLGENQFFNIKEEFLGKGLEVEEYKKHIDSIIEIFDLRIEDISYGLYASNQTN